MGKEVSKLDHNYSSLNTKVDIIVAVVTKVVESYTSLLPKVDKKSESDTQSFAKLEELLGNLTELVSKLGCFSRSLITLESLSQNILSLESTLTTELALLMKLVHLMPTDAPPDHT
ncbi:unnamed protein product [Lactuca saligna]|uniref:Uncharacterized protein n=1 Tax=Lactuca saligna TaxID=75948 RepID=A0AA35Y6B3_LACSI|nr:unnamed protein product [Lactuca saligna]